MEGLLRLWICLSSPCAARRNGSGDLGQGPRDGAAAGREGHMGWKTWWNPSRTAEKKTGWTSFNNQITITLITLPLLRLLRLWLWVVFFGATAKLGDWATPGVTPGEFFDQICWVPWVVGGRVASPMKFYAAAKTRDVLDNLATKKHVYTSLTD